MKDKDSHRNHSKDKWLLPLVQPMIRYLKIAPLTIILISPEWATATYTPPAHQKQPPMNVKSKGGTSRGCANASNTAFTLLAPNSYSALSASSYPSFSWFVPDSSSRLVEFSIYKVTDTSPPQQIFQTSLPSHEGVMTLTPFSENQPGLEPNIDYLWQVVLFCSPASPTTAQFERSFVRVVPTSFELSDQIQSMSDPEAKAGVFARQGYWYDALSESLKLAPDHGLGETSRNLLQNLINVEIEFAGERSESQEKVSNLKTIIQSSQK